MLKLVVAIALVASMGCVAEDTYLSFAASKVIMNTFSQDRSTSDGGLALFIVAALAVALVIDIVLLPYTLPHDIWVWYSKDGVVFRREE